MLDTGEDRRVADLVGLPRRGQRSRFGLTVANDTGDGEIGTVENGPEGVAQRVAQLAAFVDRSRTFRRGMAGNAAGKRKLEKQFSQPGLILADIRVDLAVCAFEIGVAH